MARLDTPLDMPLGRALETHIRWVNYIIMTTVNFYLNTSFVPPVLKNLGGGGLKNLAFSWGQGGGLE